MSHRRRRPRRPQMHRCSLHEPRTPACTGPTLRGPARAPRRPDAPPPPPMTWHGHLHLQYRHDGQRTTALDRHHGPLRVLQRLYPEGPQVCHHVLVHPPGGLVGGDVLEVELDLAEHSHALVTTPGATRFYRSTAGEALQQVTARVAAGARLEWLPLETIAYPACEARNHLRFELAPGAEMMGWDVLALGLPAAGQPWTRGTYCQHLERPGIWLERARIDAADTALLDGLTGWAGHRVLATAWFATGSAFEAPRRQALLDAARAVLDPEAADLPAATPRAAAADLQATLGGATAPHEGTVVLRLLAHRVEPALRVLTAVRAAWREVAWGLAAHPPRIWRM